MLDKLLDDVFRLPRDMRLRLASDLVQSIIDEEDGNFELTVAQKWELARRIAEHKKNPGNWRTWEQVKAGMNARFPVSRRSAKPRRTRR